MKRGQASLELIIILSLMFTIFLIIIISNNEVLSTTSLRFNHDRVQSALDDVSAAATLVYHQGDGSKTRVYVSLPTSYSGASINGAILEMSLYVRSGNEQTIFRVLDFNATGELPTSPGNYWITLENNQSIIIVGY